MFESCWARHFSPRPIVFTFPEDETFDIGQDTRTGVVSLKYRYDVSFMFTGKINKLTFNLAPEPKEMVFCTLIAHF